MSKIHLLAFPLVIALVACNNGKDDDDTDETDITGADDTDDGSSDDDTDDVSSDDTDDTDVALTIDVSDWTGTWTVVQNSGSLCGGNAPATVTITGTAATTFTFDNTYGAATCTFETNEAFTCAAVTYESAVITTVGTWDGTEMTVDVTVAADGCTESSEWTVTPPAVEQPAEPAAN